MMSVFNNVDDKDGIEKIFANSEKLMEFFGYKFYLKFMGSRN